uniref:Chitobiosyldiphosphodolichol beta-mannosyltransferase n=1 Tax=Corethrella appendiculata TaxID=1370023 RepID=U5ER04_9DIPT
MTTVKKPDNACVIVLGDIGRSPRMQYHVKSLLENNYTVDLVGTLESKPLAEISSNPNVRIHQMNQFPDSNLPTTLKYIFKAIWQTLSLWIALFSIRRSKFILCQNPPAVPTIIVCYLYCLITRCKFIIDWHNYTHTILAINASERSLIVRMTKFLESYFGSKANENFCVTKAMRDDLLQRWNITATVLYDRPPIKFQSISLVKKHELFMKLSQQYSEFLTTTADDFKSSGVLESTAFTQKLMNDEVKYKTNRPALLISSTSWTPDEDFNILLKVLEQYELTASEKPQHYPKLLCAITGKGPLKQFYSNLIAEKNWKFVSIIMPWLENEDYPLLLAAADLGVCLHWSSSGLDLPMKVVDMFGCGLPVCAINFKCLNELVQHGRNGFVFENSQELAQQISEWFYDFPNNVALTNIKDIFAKSLREFQLLRWAENWKNIALPLLK